MTTSTGIRSATASLLARMVRKIPFPAWMQKNSVLRHPENISVCLKKKPIKIKSEIFTYSDEDSTWPVEVVDPTLRCEKTCKSLEM